MASWQLDMYYMWRMEAIINTSSETETENLAAIIAERVRGGEVFLLESDLGGGKTVFARGLAKGLRSPDFVSSPTFTISQQYNSPTFTIFHYDLYRLDQLGVIAEQIEEEIESKIGIHVIEWPHLVENTVAKEIAIKVVIKRKKNSADSRELIIEYPEELKYIFEGEFAV